MLQVDFETKVGRILATGMSYTVTGCEVDKSGRVYQVLSIEAPDRRAREYVAARAALDFGVPGAWLLRGTEGLVQTGGAQ
jgi:hypothetical protein